jgi:hypothetical protein
MDHESGRGSGRHGSHFHGHFFDQRDARAGPPQDLRKNPENVVDRAAGRRFP